MRGRPAKDKPLLVTHEGMALDIHNLRDSFRRAASLAFVTMNWPVQNARTMDAKPLDIAVSISRGKTVGFDGPKPKCPVKIEARIRRLAAIEGLVDDLKPVVEKLLEGRPMYALRHTHITWARRFANFDAVRAQVGHAGRDIKEQHYNDESFVDAHSSSQVVWDVLTGAKELQRNPAMRVLPVAVGQMAPVLAPVEKITQNSGKDVSVQGVGGIVLKGGSSTWIRTRNPRINRHKSPKVFARTILPKEWPEIDLHSKHHPPPVAALYPICPVEGSICGTISLFDYLAQILVKKQTERRALVAAKWRRLNLQVTEGSAGK